MLCGAPHLVAQASDKPAPQRTILAIGAHAGDMELTAGAVLIKQHKLGDRIVILHMTLGEGETRGCRRPFMERRKDAKHWPPIP